jgi:catechol 2,3-dioxygenase-like lactoylglutathione lyase family enzyme
MNLSRPVGGQIGCARIVHLAIQADDLEGTAAFYKNVYGMRELVRLKPKNLSAIYVFDGAMYISIFQYHSFETAESRAVPRGPRIHHMGLEVAEPASYFPILLANGCSLISPEGELPIKFLMPDGVLAEIVEDGYFQRRFNSGSLDVGGSFRPD